MTHQHIFPALKTKSAEFYRGKKGTVFTTDIDDDIHVEKGFVINERKNIK